MSRLAPAVALLPLMIGCESGLATVVHVEVADAVATAHRPDAPGVLVTDAGPLATAAPLAALCGEPVEKELVFSHDHGFGCLNDDMKGTEEVLRAWVQPAPEGWDFAALCALQPHPFRGLDIGPAVTGEGDTSDTSADTAETSDTGDTALQLAPAPDPTWPQGQVTATWKRDVSPCGGILRGDVRVE